LLLFHGGWTYLSFKSSHDVLQNSVIAVTARSASFPEKSCRGSSVCSKHGDQSLVVVSEELDIDGFVITRQTDATYAKKEPLQIRKIADEQKVAYMGRFQCGDHIDYRPGRQALKNWYYQSFKGRGLTKEKSGLVKQMGLPTWSKPAFACLTSRFPIGKKTPGKNSPWLISRTVFNRFRI
jgi:uncharacterized protein